MTTSSWDRSRRAAAAVSVLTVIAVAAGAVILALGIGVPETWWPHTGQAFALDARPAGGDPCALIMGPAKAYCERGATPTASAGHQYVVGGAWGLVPAGAGGGGLVGWRVRGAAGGRG